MDFSRNLELKRPMMRGGDVEAVQERLLELGWDEVGRADGIFGSDTAAGIREFQRSSRLAVDGVVGRNTWTALFETAAMPSEESGEGKALADLLNGLTANHSIFGGVAWRLAENGIRIEDAEPETTVGRPVTVGRVWDAFGEPIANWGAHFEVPAELIVATICTETRGDSEEIRREPGFISDELTPHRISPGLMQTLISTARRALEAETDAVIDRAWLLVPANSIRAGTAYIRQQRRKTFLDPPKVACAYNAGSVIRNDGPNNRWKMRQFPIGTSAHADRFVRWFNDAFRLFEERGVTPSGSFREFFLRRAG